MRRRPTRLRPPQGGAFFPPVFPLTRPVPSPPQPLPHAACGCADPTCTLPPGRCFLCKSPVGNARTYAVCAACDEKHAIRATWAREYERVKRDEASAERECFCPGWLWMNEDDDGSFNLERCDCCALLADDLEAAERMGASIHIASADIEWP